VLQPVLQPIAVDLKGRAAAAGFYVSWFVCQVSEVQISAVDEWLSYHIWQPELPLMPKSETNCC